jgi:hypothetical protein
MEVFVKKISERNNGSHLPKHLIVFAPITTLLGASAISLGAARLGMKTTFFAAAAIANARPPDYYWCPPFKNQPHLIVEPKLLKIIETIYEKAAYIADPWCNWSARRMAPDYALRHSEKELLKYGLTNQEVLERTLTITPEFIRSKIGLDPRQFITQATINEALMHKRVRDLKNFLLN